MNLFTDPVGREVRAESITNALQITRSTFEAAMEAERKSSRGSKPGAVVVDRGGAERREPGPGARFKRPVLSKRETVLVTGVIKGGPFLSIFQDAEQYLPEGQTLSSLVAHPDIQAVIAQVSTGATAGATLLDGVEDPRVRAVVSEALMDDSTGDGETSKRFTEAEFRHALQMSLASSWARFSQGLKQRLRDAELSKDAKLHADLMNEYLDVQRRMKELGTFYDEE